MENVFSKEMLKVGDNILFLHQGEIESGSIESLVGTEINVAWYDGGEKVEMVLFEHILAVSDLNAPSSSNTSSLKTSLFGRGVLTETGKKMIQTIGTEKKM